MTTTGASRGLVKWYALTAASAARVGASAILLLSAGVSCGGTLDDSLEDWIHGRTTPQWNGTGGVRQVGTDPVFQEENGIGGAPNSGGAEQQQGAGGAATPGQARTSIPLTNGFYTDGTYAGYLWTAHDTPTEGPPEVGSQITPHCAETGECFVDTACVKGYTAAIPKLANGDLDYAGVWGVAVGWQLNAEPSQGVDLSAKKAITVGISGSAVPSMRLLLEVPDPNDPTMVQTFCAPMMVVGGGATVKLTSFKTECWSTTGTPFDPATMRPESVAVQLVASRAKVDFDFCISKLALE